MKLIAEPAVVAGLWDALSEPVREPRRTAVTRLAARIVERGWAYVYEVEDLVSAMGLGWWWQRADLNALFGLPVRTIFNAPRRSSTSCSGGDALAAADVAGMVLLIEQLGLAIDPTPIVEAVLPNLAGRKLVSASELAVLWWKRKRHRLPAVWVEVPSAPKNLIQHDPVRLASGYRATAGWSAGQVAQIHIAKPVRRRRSPRLARAA